jgi:pimeloyl-ACP methyl ester carboxylesterase
MPRPPVSQTIRDYATFRAQTPLRPSSVRGCPPGDGSAVLVIPGILRGDGQTLRFRNGLQMLGYVPFGWELGINAGPTPRTMIDLSNRIGTLAQHHGKVRIVGFSMGGLFARWAAQARSQLVSQVVTICAPFRDPLDSAWLPLRALLPLWPDLDVRGMSFMIRQTPSQPWAAIYSRRDGVTAWQSCMDPRFPDRCFEVATRHTIAMREEAVFRQSAACLAQTSSDEN